MRSVGGDTSVHDTPIHVREEGLDVFTAVCRRVVEQKGMLPDIHDEHRLEAGNIAVLMQGDPVVAEASGRRLLKADRPSLSAHFSYADEVGLPALICAERPFDLTQKRGRAVRF